MIGHFFRVEDRPAGHVVLRELFNDGLGFPLGQVGAQRGSESLEILESSLVGCEARIDQHVLLADGHQETGHLLFGYCCDGHVAIRGFCRLVGGRNARQFESIFFEQHGVDVTVGP